MTNESTMPSRGVNQCLNSSCEIKQKTPSRYTIMIKINQWVTKMETERKQKPVITAGNLQGMVA